MLTLSIRWLPAVDAFAASCVSYEWQAALASIRDNGDLWKQVCMNSYPPVTPKIKEAIDFRCFALGLLREKPQRRPRETFSPSMRAQDFFAVVDLYRKPGKEQRLIMASWICPVQYPFMKIDDTDNEEVVLKGVNPYRSALRSSSRVESWQELVDLNYELSTPMDFAAFDLWGASWSGSPIAGRALWMRVTLFRRDTMQSTCVMDETFNNFSFANETIQAEYGPSVDGLHFNAGEAGRKARCLMRERGYSQLSMAAQFCAQTSLPRSETKETPTWLEHANLAKTQLRRYAPCQGDLIVLSKVSHIGFNVSRFQFAFKVTSTGRCSFKRDFRSEDDMLVALEGLFWE